MDDSEIEFAIKNAKKITEAFKSFLLINEQIKEKLNRLLIDPNNPKFEISNDWGKGSKKSQDALPKGRIKKVLHINGKEAEYNIYPRYTDSNVENGITVNYSFGGPKTNDKDFFDYFKEKLSEEYENLEEVKDYLIIKKDYSSYNFVDEVCKDAIILFAILKDIQDSYKES